MDEKQKLLLKRTAMIAGKSDCWIGVGAVISRDGRMLVEAFNETLEGEEYCREFRNRKIKKLKKGLSFPYGKDNPYRKSQDNAGCIRHELGLSQGGEIEKTCSVHAEANAIAKAARGEIEINGATMFVTSYPCLICMRSIIAAGIKKVVYMNNFYKPHHEELFAKNGVEVQQISEDKVWRRK